MDDKYILIVDDDEDIQKSFRALLEMKGYRVSSAKDGKEALMKVLNNYHHLALIDIKLPDMEGTELLIEFHQLNPQMKKVIITGCATLDNAIESLNLKADGYLVKPVKPGELLGLVADKLMEQEMEIKSYEDTVSDLIKAKMQEDRGLDRYA